MKAEIYEVRIKFLTPILGSIPDKTVFDGFLSKKMEGDGGPKELIEQEKRYLSDEELLNDELPNETGTSKFYKTKEGPFICDYAIKGFLKYAGDHLKNQIGIAGLKSKLQTFAFIAPRKNYFINDKDEIISAVDPEGKHRTKSINGKFGEKLSVLGSSEKVSNAGLRFYILVIENKKTKESGALTGEVIKEILEYGRLSGLGQWRNAGFGAFRVASCKKTDLTLDDWDQMTDTNDGMDNDIIE